MSPTSREVESRASTGAEPQAEARSSLPAKTGLASRLAALKGRIGAGVRSKGIAFIGVGEVSDGIRLGVPVAGLAVLGKLATVARSAAQLDLARFDTLVFSRPQLSATAPREIELAQRSGSRVVIDLDDDFYAIPPDHPGYHGVGPGNPARLQALERLLAQADLVVVATPALAERYAPLTRHVTIIPNGWSRSNPLWEQPLATHESFNIGWAGTPTHRADLALLADDVVAFMRRTPAGHLIIGGDPVAWRMFADLPEARRTFVPMLPFEQYPNLLAQFDVLLAPLCANAFNEAKSDIKLLEAGIRRIPWVASPRAAYMAWGDGGLFADAPGEWLKALVQLEQDPALRVRLSAAGRALAEQREAAQIARLWLEALA